MKPTKLVCILIFISPFQLKAEVFSCEDSGSTELDMFGSNTSHNAPSKKNINSWIIDTNKGWRRSDIEALLRGDDSPRLADGWRHEEVGVPMQDLLMGKATLAFSEGRLLMEKRSS